MRRGYSRNGLSGARNNCALLPFDGSAARSGWYGLSHLNYFPRVVPLAVSLGAIFFAEGSSFRVLVCASKWVCFHGGVEVSALPLAHELLPLCQQRISRPRGGMSPAVALSSPSQLLPRAQEQQLRVQSPTATLGDPDRLFANSDKERSTPTGGAEPGASPVGKGSSAGTSGCGFDWRQVVSFIASAAAASGGGGCDVPGASEDAVRRGACTSEARCGFGELSEGTDHAAAGSGGVASKRRRRRESAQTTPEGEESWTAAAHAAKRLTLAAPGDGAQEAAARQSVATSQHGERQNKKNQAVVSIKDGESATKEGTLASVQLTSSAFCVRAERADEATALPLPPSPPRVPPTEGPRRSGSRVTPPCAQCDSLRQQLLSLKVRGLDDGSEASRALEAAVEAKQVQLDEQQRRLEDLALQLEHQRRRQAELEGVVEEQARLVEALRAEKRDLGERLKLQAVAEAEQQQVLEATLDQLRRARSDNSRLRRLVDCDCTGAAASSSSRSSSHDPYTRSSEGRENSFASAPASECAQSELSVESIDDYIFDFQHHQGLAPEDAPPDRLGGHFLFSACDERPVTSGTEEALPTEAEKGASKHAESGRLKVARRQSSGEGPLQQTKAFLKLPPEERERTEALFKRIAPLVAVVDAACAASPPRPDQDAEAAGACSVCGADVALQELHLQAERAFRNWEEGWSLLHPGAEDTLALESVLVDLWQPLVKRAASNISTAATISKKAAVLRQQRLLLFVLSLLLRKVGAASDAEWRPRALRAEARSALCISLALVDVWMRDQRRLESKVSSRVCESSRGQSPFMCKSCKRGAPLELLGAVRKALLMLLGGNISE